MSPAPNVEVEVAAVDVAVPVPVVLALVLLVAVASPVGTATCRVVLVPSIVVSTRPAVAVVEMEPLVVVEEVALVLVVDVPMNIHQSQSSIKTCLVPNEDYPSPTTRSQYSKGLYLLSALCTKGPARPCLTSDKVASSDNAEDVQKRIVIILIADKQKDSNNKQLLKSREA